jgi:succinate dehydrogenase / fumarate reductase flavoprotein subunit
VLKNNQGERFMFRYIPEAFKNDVADSEAEAVQWVREVVAGKQATVRRPPELLTRDVVTRAILKEVGEGRGSPHGGVFLDIATQRAAEDIKRKLPSMYHQFLKLANVDITKEPMEVGPTAHYIMGGVKVDPETAMSTLKGLFAAGEAAAGLHGSNRLGGNSLSDLIVFGRRAGLGAAQYVMKHSPTAEVNPAEVEAAMAHNLSFFERRDGENPYTLQHEIQMMMNDLVGIMRTDELLARAAGELDKLEARIRNISVGGGRIYNPGWHVAMDLRHIIHISRAIALAARERRESRGGHSRSDFPDYDAKLAKLNLLVKNVEGKMQVVPQPRPEMPPELKTLVEEA